MLIVISAIASAICLLGVLLVGYSTSNTVRNMPEVKAPDSKLVAFPADIEQQLQQQQPIVTPGVAALPVPTEDTAQQLADSLRDKLAQVKAGAPVPDQLETPAEPDALAVEPVDVDALVLGLQDVLLNGGAAEVDDVAALRDYALRQLSGQDGSITLPQYSVTLPHDLSVDEAVAADLAGQLADLQDSLNSELAALPELQDRQFNVEAIELGIDPAQLQAALDALALQSDMLGLEFPSDLRYDTLQELGDTLLAGTGVTLEGLDLNELETVSRDLMNQLGADLLADDDLAHFEELN
jgi:hypothetical protein